MRNPPEGKDGGKGGGGKGEEGNNASIRVSKMETRSPEDASMSFHCKVVSLPGSLRTSGLAGVYLCDVFLLLSLALPPVFL